MYSCLVIIPTYNEVENIFSIVTATLDQGPEFHVLIVDDNSPDDTSEVVREMQKTNERIHLIIRKGKLGLGTAYIEGFRYGLEHNFDYIFEMDADFSHNPNDLKRLLKPVLDGGFDVAIGSRYVQGGDISNWPNDRKILSFSASVYVRMVTWMPVKDPTAGFICYKREVLQAMDLNKISFIGYAFQIEMKFYAWKKGFRLVEIPIVFSDREKGKSKMHSNIVTEAIKGVLSIRLNALRGYYS